MPARIHPGAPILVMDHSVITLRQGGRQTAFLSMYDIAYHREHGAGRVALLAVPSAGVDAVFTTRLELGRAWQARLRAMGNTDAMLTRDVIVLTGFWREPWVDDGLGYRFRAAGIEVEARWRDLDAPFYADGQNGGFSDTEDISSLFVGARSASITVNGVAAPGSPFAEEAWLPKLGRTVSSAHAALAETRVTPAR
jgi:hypothetical protein